MVLGTIISYFTQARTMAHSSTDITDSWPTPTTNTAELSSSWEERAKYFARRRDDLVMGYNDLQAEVGKTLKGLSTTTDKNYINHQLESLTESIDDLFIETLVFLRLTINSYLDETKVGLCFQLKVQIIRFIIEGIVQSHSVQYTDYHGILDILKTHIGRLTLDASVEWDDFADRVDIAADDVFNRYAELAAISAAHKRNLSEEVLLRDMRWFRDCWHQVNWYHPQCSCVQCIDRAESYPFQEVKWDDDRVGPRRHGFLSGAEPLDPLQVWGSEMNDHLGETY